MNARDLENWSIREVKKTEKSSLHASRFIDPYLVLSISLAFLTSKEAWVVTNRR